MIWNHSDRKYLYDQSRAPLADAVKRFRDSERLSFHIPGHKGMLDELRELLGSKALRCDLTEIHGLDDFHEPENIIKEAQELAADCFGAEQTFFLPNSTSSGLMAAVAAAAREDEPVLTASDCHKSVTNGLIFGGGMPVYINSVFDSTNMLMTGISAESVRDAFEKNKGIRCIVLTNPGFYGTYSNIREIVKIAHTHGACVIVDEAHGAQLRFGVQEGLCDAMRAGADISVQSTHKMLGSLTQSAMLHIQGSLADRERIRNFISVLTSTSPSYLLMASLDEIRRFCAMRGYEVWDAIINIRNDTVEKLNNIDGIRCIEKFRGSDGAELKIEASRIIITAEDLGISGYRLSELLRERGIDAEFADLLNVVLLLGSGTDGDFPDKVSFAVKSIADDVRSVKSKSAGKPLDIKYIRQLAKKLSCVRCPSEMSPRKAALSPAQILDIGSAEGFVSARNIAVYPPGIPMVHAGESFTAGALEAIGEGVSAGLHFHGIIRESGGIKVAAADDGSRDMLFNCIF